MGLSGAYADWKGSWLKTNRGSAKGVRISPLPCDTKLIVLALLVVSMLELFLASQIETGHVAYLIVAVAIAFKIYFPEHESPSLDGGVLNELSG